MTRIILDASLFQATFESSSDHPISIQHGLPRIGFSEINNVRSQQAAELRTPRLQIRSGAQLKTWRLPCRARFRLVPRKLKRASSKAGETAANQFRKRPTVKDCH